MESTEEISVRKQMVDMHDYFRKRIDESIKQEHYIEASWLIYSCLENRFFRILNKYKHQCKYCTGKSKCKDKHNKLAISTKIQCVQRLNENNVLCISDNFRDGLFNELMQWTRKRNNAVHDLLSLEKYSNIDEIFKESAIEGKHLLDETYDACTGFRRDFYADGYVFEFPEAAMEDCRCAKSENDNNKS